MTQTAAEPQVSIDGIPGDWYMAGARRRHVAALAEDLTHWDIPTCVPRSRQGILIPGYVFAAIETTDQWYMLRQARFSLGVPQRIVNRDRFVREMGALLLSIEHNPDLGLCPKPTLGKVVEVVGGLQCYRGHRGIVKDFRTEKGMLRVILKMTDPESYWPHDFPVDDVEVLA